MSMFSDLESRVYGKSGEEPTTPGAELGDLAGILAERAREHPDELDWRRSIVDLLRLLDLDASYGARKELAIELGYSEQDILTKGSAEMNIWLNEQVMERLAGKDGRVPAESEG